MALFLDGPPAGMEDLTAQDSQLLQVATAEGIDVTRKLQLAHTELGEELRALLTNMRYPEHLFWVPAMPELGAVVVTPVLKFWHIYRTLELVYTDAYNNQLNDRYAGKRDRFHELVRWAYDKLVQNGIGIQTLPLPQASKPQVTAAPGSLPAGTYFVTAAWVNTNGEEGLSALPAVFNASGTSMRVEAGSAPSNATGWNVYVGAAPDAMTAQNASSIPAGQSWLQPSVLLTTGRAPGTGQRPSYMQPTPRILQRG
jgi:hypothetical protein